MLISLQEWAKKGNQARVESDQAGGGLALEQE